MKKIYLDSNATTQVHPEVIEAMVPFFGEIYGNASSVHLFGREAKKHLEKARSQVAKMINASSSEEIVFTAGGTEADNYAMRGIAEALKDKGNHIITSSVEHPAVLNTCKYFEKQGYEVTYLGVDEYGIIDLDELAKSIKDKTILITIMAANNETGTIMPIDEISAIAQGKGVPFHSDAVQYVGKMPLDVQKTKIDLISMSGHKINGPKGVGALYIKKGTKLAKFRYGGHQEKGRRPGTENVPGIVGLGKACEIATEKGQENYARVQCLRDKLHERIQSEIKMTRLNGHPEKRLPNTLNIGFDYLEGESILLSLDLEGVAVSTGSACTSGSLEPSHVLMSMGIDALYSQGSVRFSFSIFNTEEEIDYVMEKLPAIIARLRAMSPVYPGDE
ncbi:MAG: cysteine desulfurase NifS [Candidatus Tantalella remota]|nr:cysteine desulfurase NifS [Candidatus Tantalella remota]